MPRERTGSIKEVDGEFLVRVTYHDPSGKRRDIKRKVGSKSRANKLLKKLLGDIDEGVDVSKYNKLSMAQFFDLWMKTKKSKISKRTFSSYEQLIRLYILPNIGGMKFSKLSPLAIQSLYSTLEEKGLSAKSIHYVHALLRVALKQAVKWKMISSNPALSVELPKIEKKEMKSLSREEAARFIKAASNDKHGLIFLLALGTGMRPEEYLGLQWKDINLENGVATIQRTLCWNRKGGGWYFGEPKTKGSNRVVIIPKSIVVKLKAHKLKQNEER